MSKFLRTTLKPFAGSPGFEQVAQFGSLAAASPVFTTNVATIQSLGAWQAGWFNAVIGGNSPAIEDMNAVLYVSFQEMCNLFQDGIPYWDAGTTYYGGSLVNNAVCVFTVTSANATAGATYTNNGQTFTVQNTITAGTTLTATIYGGLPTSSGTLTKASGTGDTTITFSTMYVTTGIYISIVDANLNNMVTNASFWSAVVPTLGQPFQHINVNSTGTGAVYTYQHINSSVAISSLTVPSGYNDITGFLTIPVGDTYTIAGSLCCIGTLTVLGTIMVTGTLRIV